MSDNPKEEFSSVMQKENAKLTHPFAIFTICSTSFAIFTICSTKNEGKR